VDKLKIGDVVTLNSGGPEMTVNALPLGGPVTCLWFSGDDLKSGNMALDALTKVPSGTQGKA
jgi:uncharacterized protein YodC (DUF2158 family)